MNDLTVTCGCGRKMALDARRGLGAYRCGCGVRIVAQTPPPGPPECVAITEDGDRCSEPPAADSVRYEVSLCGEHMDGYRKYAAIVRAGREQRLLTAEERAAEGREWRERMTLEALAKRASYLDQAVVYYVRIGDVIKIGTTTNMKARMSKLMPDDILATGPGSNELEKQRHREFAHIRVRGERFRVVPELLAHIAKVREEHGEPVMTDYRRNDTPEKYPPNLPTP